MRPSTRQTDPTNESLPSLRQIVIDEDIDVWVAFVSPKTLDATVEACQRLPRRGEATVVACLPRETNPPAVVRALAGLGGIAHVIVIVATDEERLRWGALGRADICALARRAGSARVVIEPDPERAVVGSMQWLKSGDTFCILWPRERGTFALFAAVELGSRWRGTWDAPEDGEFHVLPRDPEAQHGRRQPPTDNTSRQGEDR